MQNDLNDPSTNEAEVHAYVRAAKAALPEILNDCGKLASAYTARESTDFLGRLNDAHATIEGIFDDQPDGDISLEAAHEAFEGYEYMAALALAQMAMLRALHPTVGKCPDDHDAEDER